MLRDCSLAHLLDCDIDAFPTGLAGSRPPWTLLHIMVDVFVYRCESIPFAFALVR